MPRNVEIKAAVKDVIKLISRAKEITNNEGEILLQEDVFFTVPQGRLKLRQTEKQKESQLIFYNRADTEGPKLSDYSIATVNNNNLAHVLELALGVKGKVKKTRYLFLYGQTRIHIDQVEGLGDFMELEVVLTPDQTLEQGQTIAMDLLTKLNIPADSLLSGAYIDHLINK